MVERMRKKLATARLATLESGLDGVSPHRLVTVGGRGKTSAAVGVLHVEVHEVEGHGGDVRGQQRLPRVGVPRGLVGASRVKERRRQERLIGVTGQLETRGGDGSKFHIEVLWIGIRFEKICRRVFWFCKKVLEWDYVLLFDADSEIYGVN